MDNTIKIRLWFSYGKVYMSYRTKHKTGVTFGGTTISEVFERMKKQMQEMHGNDAFSEARASEDSAPSCSQARISAPTKLFTSQHQCGCGTFEDVDKHSGDKCNHQVQLDKIEELQKRTSYLNDRCNALEDKCLAYERMAKAYEKAFCLTTEAIAAKNRVREDYP